METRGTELSGRRGAGGTVACGRSWDFPSRHAAAITAEARGVIPSSRGNRERNWIRGAHEALDKEIARQGACRTMRRGREVAHRLMGFGYEVGEI